jgi:hypothetical protein
MGKVEILTGTILEELENEFVGWVTVGFAGNETVQMTPKQAREYGTELIGLAAAAEQDAGAANYFRTDLEQEDWVISDIVAGMRVKRQID